MNQSISQLVVCPRCGHRFELSETFRKHFEAEKQADIDAALRDKEAQMAAAQQEREVAILEEAARANQAQLEESAEREKALQEQLQANQEAREEREAQLRAELSEANQAQLAESAQREKALQEQLQANQESQEEREAQLRAELGEANQAQLAESAQREKALQEQLQANQEAQAEREAQLRAELGEANRAQLEESAQREKALQEQLQANQEEQVEREAKIRAEADAAAQQKLAESQQRTESLEAREQELLQQLQTEQAERDAQEKLIRDQAEKDADEKYAVQREQDAIKLQRLEKVAADAKKKMTDMQRQLGQGSVELQGEALEVYLKRLLQEKFPFDQIEDVVRGQPGADLTQTVNDGHLGGCGLIVWEAKRTKHWYDDWLDKIKSDADRVGSQVRVIVSQALPAELRPFGLKEGVWVSSVEAALPLATILRSKLVESARLQRAGQGKELKMDEIYRYLTSPRFGERIQRMVETWEALEQQVAREEQAMKRQWRERRKQLARMKDTTTEMFTDFSAILGREIAQVPGLELAEALPPGESADANDIMMGG